MSGSHPVMHASHRPAGRADSLPRRQSAALRLLRRHGEAAPAEVFGLDAADPRGLVDATATAMMDLYRRSGSPEVFEVLVGLAAPGLSRRVNSRIRCLGCRVDAQEILQDTLVNIYRYPDKFDASRPGAFRAWSSTIVDNTIRRHLRRARSHPDLQLRSADLLAREPDLRSREPVDRAIDGEACRSSARAFVVLLGCYLAAYNCLSERERFVLQMVEVKGLRYAELAGVLGIRPEALKMVVFRARRRIHQRMQLWFARAA